MEKLKMIPCYVVFENEVPEIAFFDKTVAEGEVCSRKATKHITEDHLPDGTFYTIRVVEVPLVDRRKSRAILFKEE